MARSVGPFTAASVGERQHARRGGLVLAGHRIVVVGLVRVRRRRVLHGVYVPARGRGGRSDSARQGDKS